MTATPDRSPSSGAERVAADPEADGLVQVGWTKFDGDEFHAFYYFSVADREQHAAAQIARNGFLPVYVRREDFEDGTDD